MNVCVCLLATCEGNFHTSHPAPELGKKRFVCLFVLKQKQLCGTCQEEDEA